jgi:invasion protein IalB
VRTSKIVAAAALLALLSGPALAQQAAPSDSAAQPAQANETQHVGDWLVRCFPVKVPAPCDMIYILAVKKTNQMLLSLRFAYAPSQDRNLFQMGVPLGVSFAKGLVISSDSGVSSPLPFVHCDRSGCFVESIMDDASMDTLASAPGGAKVRFFSYTGQKFALAFPLNGFVKARESMVQLARARVQSAGK